MAGLSRDARKCRKDRDILTAAALLRDDAGSFGHFAEQGGQVAFELGDGHAFYGKEIGSSGQGVNLGVWLIETV